MSNLLVLFVTIFVIAIIVFTILSFVGCPMYPRPKFTCAECEQSTEKYKCKACTDEVTGEAITCGASRGTKDCYKNARKASGDNMTAKNEFCDDCAKKEKCALYMFQGIIGTIEWCGKKEASNEQQQEKA